MSHEHPWLSLLQLDHYVIIIIVPFCIDVGLPHDELEIESANLLELHAACSTLVYDVLVQLSFSEDHLLTVSFSLWVPLAVVDMGYYEDPGDSDDELEIKSTNLPPYLTRPPTPPRARYGDPDEEGPEEFYIDEAQTTQGQGESSWHGDFLLSSIVSI